MGHLPCKYVKDVRLILKRIINTGSQEDVHLALDHGVGVRMPDSLGLHGTSGLGVGVRPLCILQNVPNLE